MDDREQRIKARAHQIWEEEGRPAGLEREHWERAAREIDAGGGRDRAPEQQSGPDEIAGSVGVASGLQPGGTKPGGGPGTGAGSTDGAPAGAPRKTSRT